MRISDWSSDVCSSDLRAVVWFGNGGSTYTGGIRDIAKIRAALEAVNREIPLSLSVVSNRRDVYREVVNGWSVPTQYVEWNLKSSARIIAEHDVAVIPVVSNPYTVCTTNNRLVLDRKSARAGKRVSVRVDPGGCRKLKKK